MTERGEGCGALGLRSQLRLVLLGVVELEAGLEVLILQGFFFPTYQEDHKPRRLGLSEHRDLDPFAGLPVDKSSAFSNARCVHVDYFPAGRSVRMLRVEDNAACCHVGLELLIAEGIEAVIHVITARGGDRHLVEASSMLANGHTDHVFLHGDDDRVRMVAHVDHPQTRLDILVVDFSKHGTPRSTRRCRGTWL